MCVPTLLILICTVALRAKRLLTYMYTGGEFRIAPPTLCVRRLPGFRGLIRPIYMHTQRCHFILLDTLFIFAGHQEKLQNTIFVYAHAHARGRFPRDAEAVTSALS